MVVEEEGNIAESDIEIDEDKRRDSRDSADVGGMLYTCDQGGEQGASWRMETSLSQRKTLS